ncbi:unnamed protein product [Rodentolepis nana]|uniref:GPI ethanolamine phosphate transferase 1 n=1 Tax=Rodentolepis nana TaxID=102285 RepID=A0A0R3T859_RODNA|nr:unnamed protein product [Rodentolepis nana]
MCIGISYAFWSLLLYLDTFGRSDVQSTPTKSINQHRPPAWILVLFTCTVFIFLGGLSRAFHQSPLRSFYQLLPLTLALILLLTPRYREDLSHLLQNALFSPASPSRGMFTKIVLLLFLLMEFALWGFIHRILLSFGGVLLGLWPYLDPTFITLQNRATLQRLWLVALCSSICILSAVLAVHKVFLKSDLSAAWLTSPSGLLVSGSAISGLLVFLVRNLVDWSIPIPILLHVISWILLVTSPMIALFGKTSTVCERLIGISLAFFIPFNLLNTFYEGFFFLALATTVFMWIWLESGLQLQEVFSLKSRPESINGSSKQGNDSQMTSFSLRRPFFYVFFVIYAFFGTGNIASINTFDPVSVYCFITVLSPPVMGALLIFKIICPIVVVGTSYALLGYVKSNTSATSSRQEITVLMIIANFLAVHFFAMLRDEGSWLDIGESISHYVIAMSIGLASVLLSHVGGWMLTSPWTSRHTDTKLS